MTENDENKEATTKNTQLKGLLDQWKRSIEEKLHAEVLLDETRSKIFALMDADKMDVNNFHLVKVKNYGGTTDRYKNKEKGIFTWMLQIREKEKH